MTDTLEKANEKHLKMFLEQQRKLDELCFTTSAAGETIANDKHPLILDSIEDLLNKNVNLYKYVKQKTITQILTVFLIFDAEYYEKLNIDRSKQPYYYDLHSAP